MLVVERPRSPSEPFVGGPRFLCAPLEATAHDLGPSQAFRLRHPIGYQQLEDAGTKPGCDGPATPPSGDDANGRRRRAGKTVQSVVLRCCGDGFVDRDSRRGWPGVETQHVKSVFPDARIATNPCLEASS